MKNCIPAVREILIAAPAILSLIKAGAAAPRLYLMRAEQFTGGPDIVMNEISGSMNTALGEGSTGPWQARISLECRASTFAAADQLASAVKAVLLPFMGISKGLEIQKLMHAGEYADYNDEGTVFRQIVDFRIFYDDQ